MSAAFPDPEISCVMSAFLAEKPALHPNSTKLPEACEVRGDPTSISQKDNAALFLALVIFVFLSLSEVTGESTGWAI